VDSNHRPPGPEPWDSHFAGFCTGMLIFHIVPVQLVSSVGWPSSALHRHAPSWKLWLHQKGKVFEAPEPGADHLPDPFGLEVPIVLKKLTNPGALTLNLSSTYSTVLLIEVACRASVFATTSGSRS
jgi:hypothetical protein